MTLPISWAWAGKQTEIPANKPPARVVVNARKKTELVMVFNSERKIDVEILKLGAHQNHEAFVKIPEQTASSALVLT